MNIFFRSYLLFIINIALLFPAKRELDTTLLNSKIRTQSYKNTPNSVAYRQMQRGNSDEHIIWGEDFESGAENWLIGDGWELTQASYHSPNNSILSPNDDNNLDGYFVLLSPKISLPHTGLNEWLYFTFWLYADIPDFDGDNDLDLVTQNNIDLQQASYYINNDGVIDPAEEDTEYQSRDKWVFEFIYYNLITTMRSVKMVKIHGKPMKHFIGFFMQFSLY